MDPTDHPTAQLFGEVEAPRNTRERILFVALDLFYTYGFHAVGLDQILDGAELTKTTFYNHFESKDELAKEAVLLRDTWESQAFMRALHEKAGYDPKALLMACFDVLDDWFNEPRYQGCLFLMAMTDYPLPTHPVHTAAANHYLVTRDELRKMAEAAGARDPETLAAQWTQLLIGAVASYLLDRDPAAAAVARQMAEPLLRGQLEG
jgi:AcrR family transcriptional regulator